MREKIPKEETTIQDKEEYRQAIAKGLGDVPSPKGEVRFVVEVSVGRGHIVPPEEMLRSLNGILLLRI